MSEVFLINVGRERNAYLGPKLNSVETVLSVLELQGIKVLEHVSLESDSEPTVVARVVAPASTSTKQPAASIRTALLRGALTISTACSSAPAPTSGASSIRTSSSASTVHGSTSTSAWKGRPEPWATPSAPSSAPSAARRPPP